MPTKHSSRPVSPPESPLDRTMSSSTDMNSYDRFMKKKRYKKPDPSIYNLEMNKARGEEITILKQEVARLKQEILDKEEYIQRVENWNMYSDTKPSLCNKTTRKSLDQHIKDKRDTELNKHTKGSLRKNKKGKKSKKSKKGKKGKKGGYSKRRTKRTR